MHIGFLTPEYPHFKFGASAGLGTSIKNLAGSLVEMGITVSVFVYGQEEDQVFNESGINFIGIKQKKYRSLGWYLYRKHLEKVINRLVEEQNIDLVEAPDWTGITAFINLSVPVVIRIHGSDAYFCKLEGRKQKLKNRFFERRAIQKADNLVAVSGFAAGITKQVFCIDRRIKVIPNALSLNGFHLTYKNEEVKNRILYFGTIIRKKGVLELAEIFNLVIKENKKAELFLIGKDVMDIFENVSTLELFMSKLKPEASASVKHIAEVPYQEMKKYIASAEVVVLPSFAEALPMTWLEAMAMGKPLVTSNIGWAVEIMQDGVTGYTVFPKEHEKYAERILYLMGNPERARKMGAAARKRIEEKFSSEIIAEENISHYKAVVASIS